MPGGRYPHIIAAVLGQPWAIDERSIAWAAILDVLTLRSAGLALSEEEIAARIEAASNGPRAGGTRSGAVDVIPIYGVISPRMTMMSAMSGGTSAEAIGEAITAAVRDPEVSGIVLDIDSPGGAVQGITELAATIREAAQQKPVVAVANHDAASAAYWLASAATEIVATSSGVVGSVGVIGAHQDRTAAEEAAGIKTTLISAGKYKAEGRGVLTDEARGHMQATIDAFYESMVRDIAKYRGVGVDVVRSSYGEGRSVLAKAALAAGMIDRIDTLSNTIRRVASGSVARARTSAEAAEPGPAPEPAAAPAEAVSPIPPSPAARLVPTRRAQLRARLAAHSGGHAIPSREELVS